LKTLVSRIVTLAAGAMVLGTLAFGQTEMKATIPFPFRTAISTLPAGDYTVIRFSTVNGSPMVRMQNRSTMKTVIVPGGLTDNWKAGNPSVTFRCTDEGNCALSGIRTPYSAVSYAMGHNKSARDKEGAVVVIPLRAVNAD
jgi:hypothetical protein